MYTLNNSITSKLPQTSTIKFIEIWIIYGLFLNFVIIILLVLIEHLPGTNNLVFLENSKTTETQRQGIRAKDATRMFAQNEYLYEHSYEHLYEYSYEHSCEYL